MRPITLPKVAVTLVLSSLTHASISYLEDSTDGLNSSAYEDIPQHHHDRRWDTPHPASDEIWAKAVCKGQNLLDAIRETDREAAGRYQPLPPGMTVQSPFKNYPRTHTSILAPWLYIELTVV
jgi:hypothetical protein